MNSIKKRILHYFSDVGHTFDHTQRVYDMAVKLAKSEKANLKVVKLAALLHDIARKKEAELGLCHAVEGTKMAKRILKKEKYDEETIEHVADCISTHRFSKKIKPKTKEAAILQDADRLDALGAIVIARIFMHSGAKGRAMHDSMIPPAKNIYDKKKTRLTSINHFLEKITALKPNTFKTKLAKKIAKNRYKYTMDFVKRFLKEWRGEL